MKKDEALQLAAHCIYCIEYDMDEALWVELTPVLEDKTPFHMLDLIGKKIGDRVGIHMDKYLSFFDQLSSAKYMAGYVIIAQALIPLLNVNINLCFDKAKAYLLEGDEWYVCDIIGERVLGYAIFQHFQYALPLFEAYNKDDNHWVRRSVGVATHFFAKKSKNDEDIARNVLELLTPQLTETDIRVIKGVGWGLKTIGRYYPELLVDYMKEHIQNKKISAVIIRKSVTYLDEALRNEVLDLSKLKVKRKA